VICQDSLGDMIADVILVSLDDPRPVLVRSL
jgi:hypothetical protein